MSNLRDMRSLTYAAAGVDVDAGNRAVEMMKEKVRASYRPEVLGDLGGFAGAFRLPNLSKYQEPVLLSGSDGVGTKLKIAFQTGIHHTVGQDLVAMCVNDILVQGAEPLFFLDYLACGKLVPEQVATIVGGIAEACTASGCSLIGGETAEMPGFYPEGEYDLAGFAVGIADVPKLIDGKNIKEGDIAIGLPSSGLHSNGFSLVRHLISLLELDLNAPAPWLPGANVSSGQALLTPTRLYVKLVQKLLASLPENSIKGMVHITGGGFIENIPRVLPDNHAFEVRLGSWPLPPIFSWIQQQGSISWPEMFKTFNNGIGYILVLEAPMAMEAIKMLNSWNEPAYVIGQIVAGEKAVTFR